MQATVKNVGSWDKKNWKEISFDFEENVTIMQWNFMKNDEGDEDP